MKIRLILSPRLLEVDHLVLTDRVEGIQENREWERSVVPLHMLFNLVLEFHPWPQISWEMADGHLFVQYKVVDSAVLISGWMWLVSPRSNSKWLVQLCNTGLA